VKRRTLLAGGAAAALGGTALFFDELAAVARADARRSASLDVEPSVLSPASPTATATVRNDALVPLRANLAAWGVVHDGEVVVPDGWAMPLHELAPGESHSYELRLGGDRNEIGYSDSTVKLGDADPGEYVFRLDVGSGDASRTLEATFRVEDGDST